MIRWATALRLMSVRYLRDVLRTEIALIRYDGFEVILEALYLVDCGETRSFGAPLARDSEEGTL